MGDPTSSPQDEIKRLKEALAQAQEQARVHTGLIAKARRLLARFDVDLDAEEEKGGEGDSVPFDITRIRRPSLIKDVGVERHLQSIAKELKGHSITTATTIRVKNLTYTITRVKGGKAFPTVGDAAISCLTGCFRKRETEVITVLDDVSVVLEPHKTYLLLGPPKAGKTSLLRAVAGQLPPRVGRVSGSVTYNGDSVDSGRFDVGCVARYVEQLDNNEPMLTVKETFEFAGLCLSPQVFGDMWDLPFYKTYLEALDLTPEDKAKVLKTRRTDTPKVRMAMAKARAQIIMTLLGLRRCQNTIVGNEKVRGVSGGERRRVTLGEMLMGNASVGVFDEISTGLDSAATYDIMRIICGTARAFGYTNIVSLLQPPPEVMNLFDEVIVMRKNQVIYQGPVSSVVAHFESLGYKCPERMDPADFVVQLTSQDAAALLAPPGELMDGPPPPRRTREFVERYKQTEVWKVKEATLMAEPSEPRTKWKRWETLPFRNSWGYSLRVALWRELVFIWRDKTFLYARIFQNIVLGVIFGSIYYQIPTDQYNTRYGSLFMVMMRVGMTSMAQMPSLVEHRMVFTKQKRQRFYHVSAYVMACALAQVPMTVMDASTFGTIFYWLTGATSSSHGIHFAWFLATLTALGTAMQQFFRLLVAFFPNQAAAQGLGGLVMLFMLLFSGFIVPRSSAPVYWGWIIYANPISFAFQALVSNEFNSDRYAAVQANGDTLGHTYLKMRGLATDPRWTWLGIICVLVVFLVYYGLTVVCAYVLEPKQGAGGKNANEEEEEMLTTLGNEFTTVPTDEPRRDVAIPVAPAPPASSNLPINPVYLAFNDIWYSVPMGSGKKESIDLIKGVSGVVKPRTMMALMGSSGAGKTTLLDVLAGRKTVGECRGDITLNGYPVDPKTYKKLIGYVEQNDIHSPYCTVGEALEFSARLRLSVKVSYETRQAFIEEVLRLLELDSLRGEMIGPRGTGLSFEQRKRLTVAVELVANPSLLFLDEPTSGLDARAALQVMKLVKRLAEAGRTVVCTIHQPSLALFQLFDSLLLLKRGGQTVYLGPLGEGASELIGYLQSIPATVPIEPHEQPQTWMLRCIGAGTQGTELADYASEYDRSKLCASNQEEVAKFMQPQPDLKPLEPHEAPSWLDAFDACCSRNLRSYFRQPAYNFVRLVLCVLIALILGSVYAGIDQDSPANLIGYVAVVYLAIQFLGNMNSQSVISVVNQERSVFYREQFIDAYPVSAYALSWGVSEIPYVFLLVALFVNVFYWLCGYSGDWWRFLFFWLYVFQWILFNIMFGQFVAAVSPSPQVAQIFMSTVNPLLSTFSGFTIQPGNIPQFWKFMYYLAPNHYVLEGIVVTQWYNSNSYITFFSTAFGRSLTVSNWTFLDTFFTHDFKWANRWVNVGVLLAFVASSRMLFFLSLRYLRYEAR